MKFYYLCSMGKEIERKFLLAGGPIPIPLEYNRFDIKQGYIVAEKGKQVRIRLTKKRAILGIKYTTKPVRDEYEYDIPMEDGKELYKKCKLKIEKNRLSFKSGNVTYDVDTFKNGIVFVEVEFRTLKESKKWKKPSWVGKEITGVNKYSNIKMAKDNIKK